MVDLALLIILGAVTWMVSNDGAWSAGCTFLSTLIAGLLAMNFFEPMAIMLEGAMPDWRSRVDMISLLGLFIGFVFLLRMISERIAPTYIQVPGMVDNVGRWGFAFGAGYVTVAVVCTSLLTAPLPRDFLNYRPERGNMFNIAPDRQWLGFTQYVTEKPFARKDPMSGLPRAFDAQYQVVGDPANPYPNTIWPSFPIRYAMRRGAGATAAPTLQPVGPRPAPAQPGPGAGIAPAPGGGGPAPTGGF